jgi:hypothetical protein
MLPGHLSAAVRVALDGVDAFVQTTSAAHGAATSPRNRLRAPTRAQELAGNYLMGHVAALGMTLMIENPAHTVREGVDPGGKAWRSLMKAHYGYIRGTRGADGDPVDVFLGPMPESRRAWVLNQTDEGGGFDEHKVLLGFPDERSAVDAYRLSYTPGWSRFKAPVPLSIEQLKWWLQWGDLNSELNPEHLPPESEAMEPKPTTKPLTRIFWDSAAMPAAGETVGSVLYALRVDDADDGLLSDPVTLADVYEGEERLAMDALVIPAGRLETKMRVLLNIMEAASATVKPLAMQISDPIRRNGGVHVAVIYEMSDGQTITVWFHNPDLTPGKLSISDDLVSWKWQLNKKDITIVVAPEKGNDLNTREVARRVMRLVEKNSAAFARLNAGRASRMAEIEGLKTQVVEKQAELAGLHRRIEVALVERADRQTAAAAKEEAESQARKQKLAGRAAMIVSTWKAGDTESAWTLQQEQDELLGLPGSTKREVFFENMTAMYPVAKPEPAPAGTSNPYDMTDAEMVLLLVTAGYKPFARMQNAMNETGISADDYNAARASLESKGVKVNGRMALLLKRGAITPEGAQVVNEFRPDIPFATGKLRLFAGKFANPTVSAMVAGAMTPGYAEWEDALITMVQERMEASRGDAQGMVEAQEMMQRGILMRLFKEGAPAETAYQRLFGDEQPLADDEQQKPPPEPPAPVDVGLEDATAGAVELLAGNAASLATAKAIEADVKQQGGAVAWSETGQEPAAPVLDGVAGGLPKLALDSLFELDGARLIRGDISYRGRAIGSVTLNGKGEAFFTNADGSAFNGYEEPEPNATDDEIAASNRDAVAEGMMGWTSRFGDMVGAMLHVGVTDPIDEAIDEQTAKAENADQDREDDGGAWPATVLDRDNPHWQQTLNELVAQGGPKQARIGILRKGGQELIASAVYRGKNSADWFIVLAKPADRKNKENIPFPTITGAYKMGRIASILMGYVDADEASGWKIAPPDSEAGKEEGGAWTLGLVTAEGLRGVAGSRGIAVDVFNEREYLGERAIIGATLELNGIRATLEWKDGSESYSLRSIGDVDGQFDASDKVLSNLLDQFVAWKPAAPEPAAGSEGGAVTIGSVALVPFTKTSARGARVWGVRVVESGLEINPADGSGAWFKHDTKANMIEDLQRAYQAVMKVGDPVKNENAWRSNFELPPLPKDEPAESAEVKFLREVTAGAHDALALADLLEKIEASVVALQEAGQLTGEADKIANDAITRWAELDQKING